MYIYIVPSMHHMESSVAVAVFIKSKFQKLDILVIHQISNLINSSPYFGYIISKKKATFFSIFKFLNMQVNNVGVREVEVVGDISVQNEYIETDLNTLQALEAGAKVN